MRCSRTLLLGAPACALVLLAAGCAGGGDEAGGRKTSTIGQAGQADATEGAQSIILLGSETPTTLAGPTLPGVTVVGSGEARGTPARVTIRLTIGSGSPFSGPEGVSSEPIEEKELEPLIRALSEAGAREESMRVNTYVASPYGGFGNSAQLTFAWPSPREVDRAVEIAREAVRGKTRFSLQSVETLFQPGNCPRLEDKAWEAAIADARARAERLAGMTDARLGPVVSVSEALGASTPYLGATAQGCQALRSLPPLADFPSASEGTPDSVKVAVSLQVTFAFAVS